MAGAKPPRFMVCLLRLTPACSRVETLVGFGCEIPKFSSVFSQKSPAAKAAVRFACAKRAPVGGGFSLECGLLGSLAFGDMPFAWLVNGV